MSSSTSRSTWKYPEASGVFHRPLVAKLLRLVCDTAALRGSAGCALLKDGKTCVQAGGGWVNDSQPEAEFQETVNQSKAIRPPQ